MRNLEREISDLERRVEYLKKCLSEEKKTKIGACMVANAKGGYKRKDDLISLRISSKPSSSLCSYKTVGLFKTMDEVIESLQAISADAMALAESLKENENV